MADKKKANVKQEAEKSSAKDKTKEKIKGKSKEKAKGKAKEAEVESVLLTSLPQNILKIGGQVEADKNIYISQSAYKAIHNFTKDKLEDESGGMLMGYTLDGAGKTNIIIDGFIEAKHSEATPTTLTFTHQTWDYVHEQADKKYAEYKIIGWIHTHPSFGIFLSEYDKFIQQNFFDGENQIAYVVDPIQKTEGFYFWINGKIEKCNGFYIYDKTGTPIDVENAQGKEESDTAFAHEQPKKNGWKDYLLAFTTLATAVLLCFTLSLHGKIKDIEKEAKNNDAMLKAEINELRQGVLGLQFLLNQFAKGPEADTDTETETETETNIETDTDANAGTDTNTDTETDTNTDTETDTEAAPEQGGEQDPGQNNNGGAES